MYSANEQSLDKAIQVANSFFLGANSENAALARRGFAEIVNHWIEWRSGLFHKGNQWITDIATPSTEVLALRAKLQSELSSLCEAFKEETPTYTPRYFGHMVSEISLPALFGHFVALLHNPNNTSKDVSRVGGRLETEAIAMLASMVGFDPEKSEGHFTSGGTLANFEAIWRARYRMDHAIALCLAIAEREKKHLDPFRAAQMGWHAFDEIALQHAVPDNVMRASSGVVGNPYDVARRITALSGQPYSGPVLITPASKHYSWRKSANIFGLGEEAFIDAPLDRYGRLDVSCLSDLIERSKQALRPIIAIVSVAGTTEAGTVDPIDEVCDLLDDYKNQGIHIWHHVDAAYGGFFTSTVGSDEALKLPSQTMRALGAIKRADSVTLDPHKLGYVPYSCGAFIVPNHRNYIASRFQAPYIERSEDNDKWRGTIEGSRPATGAAGTWLTGKTIGFDHRRFAPLLASTVQTRTLFAEDISAGCSIARMLPAQDTNILCFSLAERGESLSQSNLRTQFVFQALASCTKFEVSKTTFSSGCFDELIRQHVYAYGGIRDTTELVLLRCVFMNPFLSDEHSYRRLRLEFVRELRRYIIEAEHRIRNENWLQ